MARTKQTARKSTGGKAPRKPMSAAQLFPYPGGAAVASSSLSALGGGGGGGGGSDFPCCVEYAKSARSACKACSRNISKGVVRIGQQYDRDHSGYHWYHVKCFRGFPRDGSTTAEGFLFGFENLSPKDKDSLRNTLEGRATACVSSEEEEDASCGEEDEDEAGTEEDESEGEDFFTVKPAAAFQQQQQQRGFGSSPVAFPHSNSVRVGATTAFGAPKATMPASEAVAGLSKAASAAGMMTDRFFAHPPATAHRALRAAIEAFEISEDVEELSDTLALIQRLFA